MNKRLIVLGIIVLILLFILLYSDMETEVDAGTKDTWIDEEYVQICEEVGAEYCISPELLIAIIETESNGEQYADNGQCKGLCQIYYSIHINRMHELGLSDIYNPRTNITLAADILTDLREQYGDDLMLTLMAYNGTNHAVQKAEAGYFSDYAEKVSKRAEELEEVRGKHNYSQYMSDTEQLERRAKDD